MASEFVIFPNPTVTEFQIKKPIDLTIESIEIYDILGRKLMTPLVHSTISIENLASGMHFVLFKTNKGTLQRRLVKK